MFVVLVLLLFFAQTRSVTVALEIRMAMPSASPVAGCGGPTLGRRELGFEWGQNEEEKSSVSTRVEREREEVWRGLGVGLEQKWMGQHRDKR